MCEFAKMVCSFNNSHRFRTVCWGWMSHGWVDIWALIGEKGKIFVGASSVGRLAGWRRKCGALIGWGDWKRVVTWVGRSLVATHSGGHWSSPSLPPTPHTLKPTTHTETLQRFFRLANPSLTLLPTGRLTYLRMAAENSDKEVEVAKFMAQAMKK